ncbi:MAG: hypothetical protein K2Y40_08815 [Reyranella sp.]|jgi:hypothetical protein|nr:hypothetical protein [Reyranella sp.]
MHRADVQQLRAVTSSDGMTANYYPFERTFLGRVAARIINESRGISRVTCDITNKPPGTIEWERLCFPSEVILEHDTASHKPLMKWGIPD